MAALYPGVLAFLSAGCAARLARVARHSSRRPRNRARSPRDESRRAARGSRSATEFAPCDGCGSRSTRGQLGVARASASASACAGEAAGIHSDAVVPPRAGLSRSTTPEPASDFFGREERLEHAGAHVARNAAPGIDDVDSEEPSRLRAGSAIAVDGVVRHQIAQRHGHRRVAARLERVVHQQRHRGLEQGAIGAAGGHVAGRAPGHHAARSARALDDALDDFAHVEGTDLARHRAHVLE
jgi:hypothetical protein